MMTIFFRSQCVYEWRHRKTFVFFLALFESPTNCYISKSIVYPQSQAHKQFTKKIIKRPRDIMHGWKLYNTLIEYRGLIVANLRNLIALWFLCSVYCGPMWFIQPYSSGLLQWYLDNHAIVLTSVKQSYKYRWNLLVPIHNKLWYILNCVHNSWDVL